MVSTIKGIFLFLPFGNVKTLQVGKSHCQFDVSQSQMYSTVITNH